ncbi:MAG TPA: hypothetical protein VGK00_00420 [Anaerolineales bacterium]
MDILPTLHTGALVVTCAPHAAREEVSALAAALALRGPLTVLDGGNRFQPYLVARLLRQQTPQVARAAKRLFIRRAFTCYQVLALLEGTPALRQPYLVLDLLSSFYDEHVSEHEARRLLEACLCQVERLRQLAPVLVTLAPPLVAERAFLLEQVCARAGRVLVREAPLPQVSQPALFAF